MCNVATMNRPDSRVCFHPRTKGPWPNFAGRIVFAFFGDILSHMKERTVCPSHMDEQYVHVGRPVYGRSVNGLSVTGKDY